MSFSSLFKIAVQPDDTRPFDELESHLDLAAKHTDDVLRSLSSVKGVYSAVFDLHYMLQTAFHNRRGRAECPSGIRSLRMWLNLRRLQMRKDAFLGLYNSLPVSALAPQSALHTLHRVLDLIDAEYATLPRGTRCDVDAITDPPRTDKRSVVPEKKRATASKKCQAGGGSAKRARR